MTRVAHYFGRDWFDQAAKPLHETYYALLRVEEAERIDAVRAKSDRLDMAYLTGYAVNDPTLLEREQREHAATLAGRAPAHRRGPLSAVERAQVARLAALAGATVPAPPAAAPT